MAKRKKHLRRWVKAVIIPLYAGICAVCILWCAYVLALVNGDTEDFLPVLAENASIFPAGRNIMKTAERISPEAMAAVKIEIPEEEPEEEEVPEPEYLFDEADYTAYSFDRRALRAEPDQESEMLALMEAGTEVHVTGTNDLRYWRVTVDDVDGYTDFENITEDYDEAMASAKPVFIWNGPKLTPSAGVVEGPSGRETYYNLPMDAVVSNSHADGVQGDYWVREDGAKMLGDYILCACDVSGYVHNRYDIVETSLGYGICSDTGSFVDEDPYQIDIAVNW